MTETRSQLLEAGIELLHEQGVRVGVNHISVASVARRAGYSTSTLYRYWDTQENFHRDLACAAIEWRDRHSIADTTQMVRSLIMERQPWQEILRVGGNSNVGRDMAVDRSYPALALRAAAAHDAELRAVGDERVAEGLRAHADLYSGLLAVYGREVRPPYTIEHVTATIAALADGFAIQDLSGSHHQLLDRVDVGEAVGTEWTLFACALEILVEGMTRSCADDATDDHRDRRAPASS